MFDSRGNLVLNIVMFDHNMVFVAVLGSRVFLYEILMNGDLVNVVFGVELSALTLL